MESSKFEICKEHGEHNYLTYYHVPTDTLKCGKCIFKEKLNVDHLLDIEEEINAQMKKWNDMAGQVISTSDKVKKNIPNELLMDLRENLLS